MLSLLSLKKFHFLSKIQFLRIKFKILMQGKIKSIFIVMEFLFIVNLNSFFRNQDTLTEEEENKRMSDIHQNLIYDIYKKLRKSRYKSGQFFSTIKLKKKVENFRR